MQKTALLLCLLLCLTSCKSSKVNRTISNKQKTTYPEHNSNYKTDQIIDYAKAFEGVKYKFGGTTKKGMDCSGLVMTAFNSENIKLPRTTSELSKYGDWIDLKEVQKGDLLFFATKKNSRKVNHVAIVTTARTGFVEFIHSTTSKGVITSKLTDRYWYFAFVQARRVL